MASKKGIAVTVAILAAVTGASFLVTPLLQDNQATFVVSDFEGYLDGEKNIQEVLWESVNIEYQGLRDGEVSPEEYAAIVDRTSSQVTAQISEFIKSKPPEEWQDSYISYMDAMKKFNDYIRETKVLASMIEGGSSEEEMADTVQKIESLRSEVQDLVTVSDESRP